MKRELDGNTNFLIIYEPIHVHVEGEEGLVIYDLIDEEFVLREKKGKIKASLPGKAILQARRPFLHQGMSKVK